MTIMMIIQQFSSPWYRWQHVNENQFWCVSVTVPGTRSFYFYLIAGVQGVEALRPLTRRGLINLFCFKFDTVQIPQKRCSFPAHYHDVFSVPSPTHSCSADSRFCHCLIRGRTSDTSSRGMYLHELKANLKPITLRYLYPQLFCCPRYGPGGHRLNRQQVGPYNIFC